MKLDIVGEIRADSPALPHITSQTIVDALENTEIRPRLENVTVQSRVPMPDGYVKFYLLARVSERSDESVVIHTPKDELYNLFERKLRAAKFLEEFNVKSVGVLSSKADGERI